MWSKFASWLRAVTRRSRMENEMDAELRFHIEAFAEDLVRSGVPHEEALRRARIEFGGLDRAKEECREARGLNLVDTLIQDLRYAVRMLRKNPGFASTVILTLGLGIGLNSAIFTVASGFLLREPPVKDPPNVVMLTMVKPTESWDRNPVTPTEFSALRGQVPSFEDMAAVLIENLPLIGRGDPESVTVARVTSNYFALLGVPAHLGRTFVPGEGPATQQFNVIISSDLWQRKFNADPAIVGKTVTLGGQIYTVVGIMPEQFKYALMPCAIWIPDSFDAQTLGSAQREDRNLYVFARLKSGVTLREAQVQTNAILERLAHDSPVDRGWVANVMTLQAALVEEGTRTAVLLLMGVVVFVLLIACANVAGIFLARYAGREVEFAVRAALGARRSRLIQQLLGESLFLALLGGGFGLLLSLWGVHLLRAKLSFNAETAWLAGKVQVDSKVFLFTCVISLLTVLLFGVLPALKSSKLEIQVGLHGGGSTPSHGRRESRLRSGFVVGQIALTVILIAATGASIQLVMREMRARLGFDPKGVLSLNLSLPSSKYPTIESQAALFSEIVQRIQGLPGVQFAAVTQEVPESFPRRVAFEAGVPPASRPEERPQAGGYFVSRDYFQVMKIPLLRGRAFSSSDSARSPRVTIVNETFVRQYFPNADPISGFIRTYGNPLSPPVSRQIVGVVADVIDRVGQRENVPQIYVPFVQEPINTMKLVIRVNGDPTALAAAVRESIWAIDKDQPIGDIKMMTQVIGAKGANDRFLGWMLASFASTAFGLATIGIFGVVAYTVAQRTHEIGVRMALGAQKCNVFRLIVGRGIFLATVGTAMGFIGAVVVVRILPAPLTQIHGLAHY